MIQIVRQGETRKEQHARFEKITIEKSVSGKFVAFYLKNNYCKLIEIRSCDILSGKGANIDGME